MGSSAISTRSGQSTIEPEILTSVLNELSVEFHPDSFYFLCKIVKSEPLSNMGVEWGLGVLRKVLKKQGKYK